MIAPHMSRRGWFVARFFLLILITGFVFPGQLQAASKRDSPRTKPEFVELPLIRSRQNHLIVRAFINDKPALLIVDTGSPGTVIASKRRSYFGLTTAPSRLNWPSRVQVNGSFSNLVIAKNMRIGSLNIVDVPVVLANMGGTEQASRAANESQVDGILGADVLFGTRAVLDCYRQALTLSVYPELAAKVPGLSLRGYQKMPMHVTEGLNCYVEGSVNGTSAWLMVDTGAFTTLLHRPFVRQLRIPLHETHLQSARINLADDDVEVAQIRKLSVGLVDIVGKNVGVTDLAGVLHQGLKNSPPVVGLLGAEILHRNHAVIDFGTRTLYLRRVTEEARRPAAARVWRTGGRPTR